MPPTDPQQGPWTTLRQFARPRPPVERCELCSAGLAGFPQLSLPLGSRLGAPLGLSLLGPAGSDRSLVRLAERIASSV